MSVLIALFGAGTDGGVGISVHFHFQLRTIGQLVFFFLLWLPPTPSREVLEAGPEHCCQCEVGSVLCLCPVALVSSLLYFVIHHMSMDRWVFSKVSVVGTIDFVRRPKSLCAGLVLRPSVDVLRRFSSPSRRPSPEALHFRIRRFIILTAASTAPFARLLPGDIVSCVNAQSLENFLNALDENWGSLSEMRESLVSDIWRNGLLDG